MRSPPDDHGPLADAVDDVVMTLGSVVSSLDAAPGAAAWLPDSENAQRAAEVAGHLRVVLAASQAGAYASALALIRTALEQHLTDELLLRADRYEQLYVHVDDERFRDWESDLAAGVEPWTTGVESIRRHGHWGVVVVRRGHDVTNEAGVVIRRISPYYSWMRHHDPLVGRPSDQELLDEGVFELDNQRSYAGRNESLYRRFLTWPAISRNLQLNGLWTEVDLRRLNVHYRFLSAFTHGTHGGYEMLERQKPPSHVCTELVLLYAGVIAAREIAVFLQYLVDGGTSTWRDDDRVDEIAATAVVACAHLWFPGGRPDQYDKWKEANRRVFLEQRHIEPRPPVIPPDQILDSDVGYYSDPLTRLAEMHGAMTEIMSGYSHRPTW